MFELLVDHEGRLLEDIVAVIVAVPPFFMVNSDLLSVILGCNTVILHSAVTPSTVAEIMAEPCLIAVIVPVLFTIATLFLFVFQTGVIFEETLAVNLRV